MLLGDPTFNGQLMVLGGLVCKHIRVSFNYMSFSRLYQTGGYRLYLSNLEPSKLLFSVTFTLEEIHQIYHNCKIVIVYIVTYLSKFQDFHQIIINTVPYYTFLAPCALNFFRVAANFLSNFFSFKRTF